jgi:hypothetical protein
MSMQHSHTVCVLVCDMTKAQQSMAGIAQV